MTSQQHVLVVDITNPDSVKDIDSSIVVNVVDLYEKCIVQQYINGYYDDVVILKELPSIGRGRVFSSATVYRKQHRKAIFMFVTDDEIDKQRYGFRIILGIDYVETYLE